jgi:hypothetical protein
MISIVMIALSLFDLIASRAILVFSLTSNAMTCKDKQSPNR